MKGLLIFLMLLIGQGVCAQKYAIKGRVLGKGTETDVLPSASVLLLQGPDSAVVAFTSTTKQGFFLLENLKEGNYLLKVTFLGYSPFLKNLAVSSIADTLQLGNILLEQEPNTLQEITVINQSPPVTVKKDTVEYNANSFQTRPNANVEQLLKKLPGLEVGRDGNISVNGESVTRIFVDGKEFFGGDLQMATKNLPADAINKIQVVDGKSEGAQFSGVDDGSREKVINLTLKDDRRNMGFGKAMGGLGTHGRYMGRANYNKFEKSRQMSAVVMSNNVNGQGFSDDGGEDADSDARNGLVTNHKGGVNASHQLSPKARINGSYRFNQTNAETQTNLTRQNFLPEGTALFYENSQQVNKHSGHAVTAVFDWKDSTNTLRVNTALNFADGQNVSSSNRQSFSVADTLVNEGERNAATQNQSLAFNSNLFYGHRFRKSGRVFSINSQLALNNLLADGRSESLTRFVGNETEAIRQRNDQRNDQLNGNLRLSYTEPLGNKQSLQANYNVSNRVSKTNLEVFDLVNEAVYFVPEQSSRFISGYLYQQAGLIYLFNREKYSFAVGSTFQKAELSRRVQEQDGSAKQSFFNWLPNARYNQQFGKYTRLMLEYATSVREPSLQQLQPVVSRYDPLNLFIGNPALQPEYSHQVRATFVGSDPVSGLFLSGNFTYGYTANPITAAVNIDERQVRTTQYVNVGQYRTISAFLNIGVPVNKIYSRFNVSPYLRLGESANLLNGTMGMVQQRALGGSLRYTFAYEEYLELNFKGDLSLTSSDYENSGTRNQSFLTTSYLTNATWYFLKHFTARAEMDYRHFQNSQTNFNQSIPILNLSVKRTFLKKDRAEVEISGINLLNRSVGATQFASFNFIEQTTQTTLGNYFMLRVTYNFSQIPKE
ncbi:outer membrane beta-barrel protein [Rufibacter tibetensis]|uniref:Outer membrane protein beta-barrel domain-containing protein n=1 Tax=Rufibacter tibetensis TaxID=512763 RepID=A0A0P0CNV0_9BACT|nr:outer membrane beta-barrel protein [Rufibacter tibetensis]ALI97882.1 hypothetical protein DC20_01435 [Rufibacter tibetensis]